MISQNNKNPGDDHILNKIDNNHGLKSLIDKNNTSQTRLPMLEVIFDKLVMLIANSYRAFTSFTVDAEIEHNTYMKFSDYINSLPLPSMIGVVRAIEWENMLLITIDNSLLYSLIEILLGGRKTESQIKVEGRPHTLIEQNIIVNIIEIFLNDLSVSFEPISPIAFQLDRLESNPKFATIARGDDIVAVLRLQIKMETRVGIIELVIPYSTLEPIKKVLQKSFLGERGSKDINWTNYIESELINVTVDLRAEIKGVCTTAGDLANIKVGTTIILDSEPNDDINVMIDKLKISSGKLGKVNDKVAIKISHPIDLNNYNK